MSRNAIVTISEQIKKDIANYSAWKQAGFPKQWR